MSFGITAPAHWALASLTFGPNEIASCITIGKAVGTLFTHQDDVAVLDVLEKYGVSMTKLPPWLMQLNFGRKSTIFRGNLTSTLGPDLMTGVRADRLHGMATFLVLCARFVVPNQTLQTLLNQFLAGELGTVINRADTGPDTRLVYNATPVLQTFINACLDSDRDSAQCRRTHRLNAELLSHIQDSLRIETPTHHRLEATKNILRDIFQCGLSIVPTAESQENMVAFVHDTMHLTSAYVALAAAANGANVRLDCISRDCVRTIVGSQSNNETLLVRLWLTQPPSQILNLFTSMAPDGESTRNPKVFDIAYGGQKEISQSCADALRLTYKYALISKVNTVHRLWTAGIDLADKIKWRIKPDLESAGYQRFLGLGLDMECLALDIEPPAIQLERALQDLFRGHEAAGPIRRSVAQRVHTIYRCSDYSESMVLKEIVAAMKLVIISLIAELITKVCQFQNITAFQYAALPERMTDESGPFWNTLQVTLLEGAELVHLIDAAVTLWGGGETGNVGSGGHALGFVAPHCHVLMDAIRDPIRSATLGLPVPMLVVCRGSIPMLPRDKIGWVKSPKNNPRRYAVKKQDLTPQPIIEDNLDIAITFQPVANDISSGAYCCWANGILLCEIDPYRVFYNLLHRELIGGQPAYNRRYTPDEALGTGGPRWLRPTVLLQRGYIRKETMARGDEYAFGFAIDAGSNTGLAICAAGLLPDNNVFIHRGSGSSIDWKSLDNLCPEDCIIFYNP